jgi:hypothetical protein
VTGFTQATRESVAEREGWRCAVCGTGIVDGGHMHHRLPRRSGGDPNNVTNSVANALHLCPACHDKIEARRAWARAMGYLIPSWPDDIDPEQVPVWYLRGWVLLHRDGCVTPCDVDGQPLWEHTCSVCGGCGCPRERCEPLWAQHRKCCPDCEH